MAFVDTLLITIGASVIKAIVNLWLKDSPFEASISEDVVDILKSRTKDVLALRKTSREFEHLQDKIVENFEAVFDYYENRNSGQQTLLNFDFNKEAVAHRVSLSISDAKLTDKLLVGLNNDPIKLAVYIRQASPNADQLFSEVERAAYHRCIDLSAQYIISLSANLPEFTSLNFEEVLDRIDESFMLLERIVNDLDKLRAASEENNPKRTHAEFEEKYRTLITNRFDRINLFGIDADRHVKRYQLSVAYVSLEVKDFAHDTSAPISVQRALANCDRTAVIGDAGSGKTTLLYWLAVNAASNTFERDMKTWQNRVPFIVELRRYSEYPIKLERIVEVIAPELIGIMPTGWIHETFRSGNAILLIDGLDEVVKSKRNDVLEWLETTIALYPKVKLVFTSRQSAYKKGWLSSLGFNEFSLAPMHFSQITKFVEFWHEAVLRRESSETEDHIQLLINRLMESLNNNTPLFKLATNPLLCAMLCALNYQRQSLLPSDKISLYEACIESLIERRDREREIDLADYPQWGSREKRVLLENLAYWALRNEYSSFPKDEAINAVSEILAYMGTESTRQYEQAEKTIKYFVERTGLLKELSVESLDFVHKTFQEYLAARAVVFKADWKYLIKHILDDQWQNTVILAVGLANRSQTDKIITTILDQANQNVEKRTRLNLLAVACLETAVELSPEIRERLRTILSSLVPPKSKFEALQLAAGGDLVVSFLKNNEQYSAEDASSCVRVLSQVRTPSALICLSTYFEDQRDRVIREIKAGLRQASPKEVREAGILESVIRKFGLRMNGGVWEVDGSLIHLLHPFGTNNFYEYIPQDASSIFIYNFHPYMIDFLAAFTNLSTLKIRGELKIDFTELNTRKLERLDLRNDASTWRKITALERLMNLRELRLKVDVIDDPDWLDFEIISLIPTLKKLSLFAPAPDDLPDLSLLSVMRQLEYLHIGIEHGTFPDLKPLSALPKLSQIELSGKKVVLDSTRMGVEYLDHLQSLVINVGRMTNELRQFEKELKMVMSYQISVKSGWHISHW